MQTRYRHDEKASLTATAIEIAERVRNREWSARTVIDAHIARIEQVNPRINAVVATRFDDARAEACALDALSDGARRQRPLLGVPFTIKEMIDVEVVQSHYGRTNNPWDLRCTPGGSSGGEGAMVGAGSAFGIGSDICGSARMPAAFCGAYAHKPTNGQLPLTGHYPVYRSMRARRAPFVTIGPITRSARDLMLLLRVMAGPDDVDSNTESLPLSDADNFEWRGRRVGWTPAPC